MINIIKQLENKEMKKLDEVIKIIESLKTKLATKPKEDKNNALKMLREAHEEWENAEKYFESVTEPDLIDYAIFKMEAARRKYLFLLKQIKDEKNNIEIKN